MSSPEGLGSSLRGPFSTGWVVYWHTVPQACRSPKNSALKMARRQRGPLHRLSDATTAEMPLRELRTTSSCLIFQNA